MRHLKRVAGWVAGLALALAPLAGSAQAAAAGDTVEVIQGEFDQARKERSLGVDRCLDWIERLYALADADVGGDQGFEALQLVLEIQDRRQSAEIERAAAGVMERMLAGYADDVQRIGPLIERSADDEFVRRVLERTTSPAVEATCLYYGVAAVIDRGYAEKIPDDAAERALATARRLGDEFGDQENARGVPFRDVVAGDLFQLQHLRIGMQAPDIEGEDLDGVPFKLSDYRGKVVVLDFWGNW